jgi:hypothetical protein
MPPNIQQCDVLEVIPGGVDDPKITIHGERPHAAHAASQGVIAQTTGTGMFDEPFQRLDHGLFVFRAEGPERGEKAV